MKKALLLLALYIPIFGGCQATYEFETSDITNFWAAYDMLETAKTKADSVKVIQENYLDMASEHFKEFITSRSLKAEGYVRAIAAYPKFWTSVRPLTEDVVNRKAEIYKVFSAYKKILPNFKQPDICFAIGYLTTGGTTDKNLIFIGTEIAASNQTVDKSEMTTQMKNVVEGTGDIAAYIAHETIHTQQRDSRLFISGKNALLEQSIREGIADFFTLEFLGLNVNEDIFEYGENNECELWKAFEQDLKNHPRDYRKWVYNRATSKERPRDLGYYIGYKIAKAFYDKQQDKKKAIKTLLNVRKYDKVYKQSQYWKESCN